MSDSVATPLIVFSRQDDNLSAVNNILRQAGHAVHCSRVEHPNELDDALKTCHPELLIYFADERPDALTTVVERLHKLNPCPPLLLVRNQINEQTIAEAMECGANDVVSLTHRNRFQAVVKRELDAYRLKVAFSGVVSSAKQYRQELKTLMEGSTEAIADIQEGIIVASNPIWAELFGYAGPQELVNLPFMDFCAGPDQSKIKGALIACLKQKWDGSPLKMNGLHADGSLVPIEINLERVSIEGDPAVRIVVAGRQTREESPEKLLENNVFRDPVTGFYHRHYFIEKVEERLKSELKGGVRAIAYIRPDNFARVHDDIGMLSTEKLLTKLAEMLKDFMLPVDVYGRFGGTMYIALLERGTMNDISTWAEQLRKTVAESVFEVDNLSTTLTCTIGLSEILFNDRSIAELLGDVEKACRKGRKDGGNRVQLGSSTTETQAIRDADSLWSPRLRNALTNNRFRLVHQPIAGLAEEMEGVFDTRVQMIDDEGNTVLASEFIPVAERSGMIRNVDRWVVGASLSFCKTKSPTLVFIRLSSDSVHDDTLRAWLRTRIRSAQVPPSKICFQISEETAANSLKQTKMIADMLKEDGFRFAVDHLGTGRGSNQLLHQISMDYMKIDGSLMQGLHREPGLQEKVGTLIETAKKLGIRTIAERIEDANTMATLWQLGIDLIQGNYVQMQGVVLEDTQSVQGLSVASPER